jgi:hypothetical protein
MWYRIAQLAASKVAPFLPLGIVIFPDMFSNGNASKDLEENMKKLIEKIEPEKRNEFTTRFNQLKQQSSSENRIEIWKVLANDVNMALQKNNNTIKDIQSIVNNRTVGTFDKNGTFDDADKIFKEYLNAEGNGDIFSSLKSPLEIIEIANFFLANANDPKYNIVKNIIKRLPQKFLTSAEVVDLILNFYYEYKLSELKSTIQRRQPFTERDKLAIDFINSKIVVHTGKIGANLFNITNKNIFGKLLGSVASSTLEGVSRLQNKMNVNQSIQQLIIPGQ